MSDERNESEFSRTTRLAFRMLMGAGIGSVLSLPFHAVGNFIDPWFRAGPVIWAIVGAVAGLCFELFTRLNARANREKP
jgi:hypothetical protein